MPALSISQDQILKIKSLGEEGLRIADICKELNLSVSITSRHFHKFFPSKKKNPDWGEDEIEHLELLLKEGLSHSAIEKIIGRTPLAIRIKASQLGFKSQFDRAIYSYNKEFWNEPNPINCAIAGFIAADGCVSVTGTSPLLAISICRIDDGYLRMLSHFLGANHPIRYSTAPHGSKMAELRIVCKDWIEPLADIYNIVPAKTHKLKLPNIPSHLMDHYFKGFSDGDGYWGVRQNRYLDYTAVGAVPDIVEAICSRINDFSQTHGPVKVGRDQTGLYRVTKGGLGAVEFAKALYSLPSPSLWRKHKLVYDFIEKNPRYGPNILSPQDYYESLGYAYTP
jgi:hypothetical protein